MLFTLCIRAKQFVFALQNTSKVHGQIRWTILEKFFDIFGEFGWIGGWCISLLYFAIFINQKLAEIPFDAIESKKATFFFFQVFV